MPIKTVPVATTVYTNVDTCEPRELLDRLRALFVVDSLYAVGVLIGVNPQYPARWYRVNSMPTTARALVLFHLMHSETVR